MLGLECLPEIQLFLLTTLFLIIKVIDSERVLNPFEMSEKD
jgi:hypothetical protein